MSDARGIERRRGVQEFGEEKNWKFQWKEFVSDFVEKRRGEFGRTHLNVGARKGNGSEKKHERGSENIKIVLFCFSAASRVLVALVALVARWTVEPFDSSGELALSLADAQGIDWTVKATAGVFVRWDALYFLDIAKHGGYSYEQQHAFFPLLPILMRSIVRFLLQPMGLLNWISNDSAYLLSGIIISHSAFILATTQLYR
jgi:hypothetical protein